MRAEPDAHARVVSSVPADHPVYELGCDAGWCEISYVGIRGYVREHALTTVERADPPEAAARAPVAAVPNPLPALTPVPVPSPDSVSEVVSEPALDRVAAPGPAPEPPSSAKALPPPDAAREESVIEDDPAEARPPLSPEPTSRDHPTPAGPSSQEAAFHFRNTRWGWRADEVQAAEGDAPVERTRDRLLYETTLAGMAATVLYEFDRDKLSSGSYVFNGSHTELNDYVRDYERVDALLREKYGPPQHEQVVWRDERFRDDESAWGLAVAMGHLFYVQVWERPSTDIRHALAGDGHTVRHGVVYESRTEAF